MNKIGIALKIDVTKIDKSKLFSGKKGTYLDATVFVTLNEADQYGNHGMITQDVGKDEKGAILGNVKIFWRDEKTRPQAIETPVATQPSTPVDDAFPDDIPFVDQYKFSWRVI